MIRDYLKNPKLFGALLIIIFFIGILIGVLIGNHRNTSNYTNPAVSENSQQNQATSTNSSENSLPKTSSHSTPSHSSSLVISSINPSAAALESTIVISGKGFTLHPTNTSVAGWQNHSHVIVYMTGSNGATGILWEGDPTSDTSITAAIPSHACTVSIKIDPTCSSFVTIFPGNYSITASIGYLGLVTNSAKLIVVNQ